MNSRIDSILTNLRPHSPSWTDDLRQYINEKLKRIDELEEFHSMACQREGKLATEARQQGEWKQEYQRRWETLKEYLVKESATLEDLAVYIRQELEATCARSEATRCEKILSKMGDIEKGDESTD